MFGIATCHFLGRLTETPKLHEVEGKGCYAYFTLAINHLGTKDKDGTFKPGQVAFPRFSINGFDAKYLCNTGEKGDVVYVEADYRSTTRTVGKNGETTVYNDVIFPVKHGTLDLIILHPTKDEESNGSECADNSSSTPVAPPPTPPENEDGTPALTELEEEALGEGGLPF